MDLGRLVTRLGAIPEPRMRRVALAEALAKVPPPQASALLGELLAAARRQPRPAYRRALDALADALEDGALIPYALRSELYEAARSAGDETLARMLFSGTVARVEGAGERALTRRGRPLSLGERKALARGHRREVLTLLLRDPHPDVVAILLGNPHLTERDVLSIASRRRAPAAALAVLCASERWGVRYAVRRALTMNPATPQHLVLRMLAGLTSPDLRSIAADGTLSVVVREQAARLLRRPSS